LDVAIGTEDLGILMIAVSIGALLFLASVVIFLLEEAAKIIIQSLNDLISAAWARLFSHHGTFSRMLSQHHHIRP